MWAVGYIMGITVGMIVTILAALDIPMWLLIGVCFFVGCVSGAIGEWWAADHFSVACRQGIESEGWIEAWEKTNRLMEELDE